MVTLVHTQTLHKLFLYTYYPPHLLVRENFSDVRFYSLSNSFLVDNGVWSILQKNLQISVERLVEKCVILLKERVKKVRKRGADIFVVIPDYPFYKNLNYDVYQIFMSRYRRIFDDCKFVYVCHGYWEAVLDGVEADMYAIPLNTLSDIPLTFLRLRKASKLSRHELLYILAKTLAHLRENGVKQVHLLGPTTRTLKAIFESVPVKLQFVDGTIFEREMIYMIRSFDTTVHRWALDKKFADFVGGKAPKGPMTIESEKLWLQHFLEHVKFFQPVEEL